MNPYTVISRTELAVILVLASALLASLVIAVGSEIDEYIRMSDFRARYPNLAVDYPHRSVTAVSFLSIPVFLAVVFARKYVVSGSLTVLFSVLTGIGLYFQLDGTGALGGDGFYSDIWVEFWAKTHWVEWIAYLSLGGLLLWHLRIFLRQIGRVENPSDLP